MVRSITVAKDLAFPGIMTKHMEHMIMVVNTLRPRQNGLHFPDDIFKCILLNENAWISIKISLKFVHTGPINKMPALV